MGKVPRSGQQPRRSAAPAAPVPLPHVSLLHSLCLPPPKAANHQVCSPSPFSCVSRGHMNLAGEDQRPAGLQATERPCSAGAKGGSSSKQAGRKTGPTPASLHCNPRCPAVSRLPSRRTPRVKRPFLRSREPRHHRRERGSTARPGRSAGVPDQGGGTRRALRRRRVPLSVESLHTTPQTIHPPGSG